MKQCNTFWLEESAHRTTHTHTQSAFVSSLPPCLVHIRIIYRQKCLLQNWRHINLNTNSVAVVVVAANTIHKHKLSLSLYLVKIAEWRACCRSACLAAPHMHTHTHTQIFCSYSMDGMFSLPTFYILLHIYICLLCGLACRVPSKIHTESLSWNSWILVFLFI